MSQPDQQTDAPVLTENRAGVFIITLNRPQAKNAANAAMAKAMAAALDEFNENDDLRVAVLTGAGGTFCSGMDLKGFVGGETPSIPGRGFLGLTQAPPAKPIIAAVEGYAVAGGFETALACDLIVAADNAKFGLPEVKRGLAAAAGGLVALPLRTHRAVALEMILTGDFYDAQFMQANGIVGRVVPAGTALDGALELAARINANGPLAVRRSKEVAVAAPEWPAAERYARQQELIDDVFDSADAKEGATAFAEKRAPRWTGK
ncbi:crotonase/enoyl-CoA hydratase family protein [Brevibacterium sp. 50QC2O2]|uniref:crotonase/enoyl-CoA hydratase family protein n=1 Tax=Brevibacterium TaxID=1696 RepID=UPI00211BEBB3|nr:MULTISPECIES: crotonase/enoyl-CoA hydratase family protein [unclassified Brevibacterium]MCQ9369502.1 crotonase/enoyl-CoA hydratase family protein [Brevibacterium sp. 91QC2O2]MCQ9386698.1 crotonase/enoyl-CoA hydratase family protein [Brevibacterium sp. 68QC2CO]MCQ9389348.1 crotonase/enoyl-CoA hydratase family protein [Brevibacterium sp. 50QC2O2]